MRISELLALGRMMILPLAGTHRTEDGSAGCAWGMIQVAAPSEYCTHDRAAREIDVAMPCECREGFLGGMTFGPILRKQCLSSAIVHLFNDHVMTRKDWTMEQLIDWIASVEPRDAEEKETLECSEKRALVAHS